ncbi:MAG: flagellar protein FlaG [Halioglobus sp.]|nr:flagellar protein FlaG [Halioglobus sp.]
MAIVEITRALAPLGGASVLSMGSGPAVPMAAAGRQLVVDGGKQSPQPVAPAAETASIEQAAAVVEEYLQASSRSLRFAVDAESGVNMFTVVDGSTGEVIRQVPSEEVLAAARYIADHGGDVASGTLLDTRS